MSTACRKHRLQNVALRYGQIFRQSETRPFPRSFHPSIDLGSFGKHQVFPRCDSDQPVPACTLPYKRLHQQDESFPDKQLQLIQNSAGMYQNEPFENERSQEKIQDERADWGRAIPTAGPFQFRNLHIHRQC